MLFAYTQGQPHTVCESNTSLEPQQQMTLTAQWLIKTVYNENQHWDIVPLQQHD